MEGCLLIEERLARGMEDEEWARTTMFTIYMQDICAMLSYLAFMFW